jgi:hypothetical protein
MNSAATAWLQALAARGVSVSLRGNRLELHPPTAYKALTDAELITLRHHREDIKAVVRAGLPSEASAMPAGNAAVSTPAPAPVPDPICPYCHQPLTRCAQIKETRLDAWQALHYSDPEEVKRRDAEATAVMMHQIGKPLPDWYYR